MRQKIKVALIGCGKIGAGSINKDYFDVSHSRSIRSNPNYEIVAIIDNNIEKAKSVAKLHNCMCFGSVINDIDYVKDSIDLAVIATSTETHEAVIKELLLKDIKNIFSEKPMCNNLSSFENILKLGNKRKVNFIVNYPRRWDQKIQETFLKIHNLKWGNILSAHGIYNGSLINIGSHMLDLLNLIFNKYTFVDKKTSTNGMIYLFEDNDKIPLIITELKNNLYPIFDLTIYCEKASIRFYDNTKFIGIKNVIPSSLHDGEMMFDIEKRVETDYRILLDLAYDDIFKCLNDKNFSKSNHINAYFVQKMIEEINLFKV
jgi:predicted dehydrogenase